MVEAKHIAAVLTAEKGRAPVLNKDIAALSERMKKMGGKSVFQAEVAEKEDDTMVNFDQIRRVLGDEKKRVDSESDPTRKADLQKRYDRLAMRVSVYDKLLNNEGYGSMSPEERKDMANIMVSLPGFCESVSLATGGRLTIEQVNKFVTGKGAVPVTPDERKAIGAIIEQFANSDRLHIRLAKNLAGLTLPPEDTAKAQEIESLRDGIKDKDEAGIRTSITKLKEKASVHNLKTADEKERIQLKYESLKRDLNTVTEAYRPSEFNDGAFDSQMADIDSKIVSMAAARGAVGGARVIPPFVAIAHGPTTDPYAAERTAIADLENQKAKLERIKRAMRGDEANLSAYKDSVDAATRIKALEGDLKQIDKDKAAIAVKEGERSVYADKYKRKLETALPDETKRFWNDVVITSAVKATEAETAIKDEKKAAEQSEEAKRKATAEQLLNKYLKLAYLKYKNGKVVGWDDSAIKGFMHKDMLSQSPAKLARSMMERVYYNSGQMPGEYRKEIKALLGEMGVGKGTPPLSLREALNKLPQTAFDEIAAQKVPEMLGYAWARGYYFDRMKLKAGEAEFLRQAYGPDSGFFDKALQGKEAQLEAAAKMLGEYDILDGGAISREKMKKIFGQDWTQGSKRLLKLTAVAGGIGAGVYGGLAFLGGGTAAAGVETLGGVVEAAKHTALAASTAATAGVRLASGAVTEAAFGVQESIADAATAAASAKAGVPVGRIPFPGVVRRP